MYYSLEKMIVMIVYSAEALGIVMPSNSSISCLTDRSCLTFPPMWMFPKNHRSTFGRVARRVSHSFDKQVVYINNVQYACFSHISPKQMPHSKQQLHSCFNKNFMDKRCFNHLSQAPWKSIKPIDSPAHRPPAFAHCDGHWWRLSETQVGEQTSTPQQVHVVPAVPVSTLQINIEIAW